MAQIVTPPPTDPKEQDAASWFRAQRVCQIMYQLTQLREELELGGGDADADVVRVCLDIALKELRVVYNELVPEEQRIGTQRVKREA